MPKQNILMNFVVYTILVAIDLLPGFALDTTAFDKTIKPFSYNKLNKSLCIQNLFHYSNKIVHYVIVGGH